MRYLVILTLTALSLNAFAQKPLKQKDLQGSWRWTGMVEAGTVRPLDMGDVRTIPMAGSPDHNWIITFTEGNVKCMVCGGSFTLKKVNKGTEIEMEMICNRAGVQCFFSRGILTRSGKNTLVLTKYPGQDNQIQLQLTKVKE